MRDLITAQEYCFSVFDGTHATPKPQKSGKPLVTSKHILDGELDIANAYNISIEDYVEINKRSKVHQWDILFSMIGTIGLLYLEKSDHIDYAIKNLGVFSCRDEKKARYLYYFLRSSFAKRHIDKQLAGAVQKFLSLGELRQFPVPVFNEFMYKNISILIHTDEKIELNNKINSELEKIAKILYNYWFVQFDFPDEFGRPYKSSGGQMVYSEILKREIPKGWKVKNVTDVVEWIGGAQPPKSTFVYEKKEGYIRFIQNRDYADNDNLTYIKKSPSNKICDEFDIMMDKYGEAGKVRYGLAGAYNVALAKIKVKIPSGQEYIRKFFESESVRHYLSNACMASTRASLNEDILRNLKIIIPEDKILLQFESQAKKIISLILNNKAQNESLSNLRDFLLPMLMNGQVTVNS